jgi:phage-related protein
MAEVGELTAKLTLDTTGFDRSLDKSVKKMKSFTGRLGDAAKKLAKLSVVAGTAATAVGAGLVKMASDAEEVDGKFNVVFENVRDQADKTAKTLAKDYGLSNKASKELLSTTGDLLTGFGFTDEEALNLSSSVQELAVDLASFNNLEGGAARASDILTKGLLGERDSMKSLGIAIREVDVQQRLVSKGQDKLTGQALLAAKAQATFELAIEQTGKAQGDFARTSDSLANKTRVMKARLEDLSVSIGRKLMPIASKLVDVLTTLIPIIAEKLSSAFKTLSDWVTKNREQIQAFIDFGLALLEGALIAVRDVAVFLVDLLKQMRDLYMENSDILEPFVVFLGSLAAIIVTINIAMGIWNTLMGIAAVVTGAFGATLALLTSPIGLIAIAIASVIAIGFLLIKHWDEVKEFAEETWKAIKDNIELVWEGIKKIIEDTANKVKGTVEDIFNKIKETVVGIWNKIRDTIEFIVNKIKEIVEEIFNRLKGLVGEAWEGIKAAIIGPFEAAFNKVKEIADRIKGVVVDTLDAVNRLLGQGLTGEQRVAIKGIQEQEGGSVLQAAKKLAQQQQGFASGGIVPGSSFSGDRVSANVNSGEMILTREQQGRLFDMLQGGGGEDKGGVNITNNVTVPDKSAADMFVHTLKFNLSGL